MSLMDGSGALGGLGITTLPQGTLAELEAEGINPQEVACCHQSRPGIIRGCAVYKECPFHLKRMGGFKNVAGPKYVGFFLQTHEGNKIENFVSCFTFVRTLQARMYAGIEARQRGKPHEIIRIVAQEGEKIITRIALRVNPNDKSDTAAFQFRRVTVEVPKYPRPGENERLTYDQELTARELARQKAEDQVDQEVYDAMRVAVTETTPDDDFTTPAAVIAEPVKHEEI